MNRDAFSGDDDPGFDPQEDADIVVVILRMVVALVPSADAIADQVEAKVRAAYGGQRVRIPKRGKHLSGVERDAVFQEGLTSMSTEEILRKHKISRRTLERQMKRGGRFDGS